MVKYSFEVDREIRVCDDCPLVRQETYYSWDDEYTRELCCLTSATVYGDELEEHCPLIKEETKLRDAARIPHVLKAFFKLWQLKPDLRFGQVTSLIESLSGTDFFYMEEDDILECANILYNNMKEDTL